MNKGEKVSLLLIFLFGFFMISTANGGVGDVPLSREAQICLMCHSDKGLTKTFKSKENLSLFVDAKLFKDSVHSFLTCTSCHTDISLENHPPGMTYKSKKEFAVKASKSCRMCHTDEQLYKKDIHHYLITKAKAPTCAECHGLHAIRRISDWKPNVSEAHYCLTCHRQELSITIGGRELSLEIDESLIRGSVHNKHTCSDCHSEFSKEQHPVRIFKGIRERSIAVSDVCRRCHSDKFRLVEGSIHFIMLKKGRLEAPVCTDCHGFHTVKPKAVYKIMVGVPCRRCHEDIFNVFKESVHGKAKIKGVEKAPICSSCHQAHDVKVTSLTEQMKKICLGCHKEAESLHKEWLWSAPLAQPSLARLHLDTIACASCHSPNIEQGLYLRLYDRTAGKPFYKEQILDLFKTDDNGLRKEIDPDGDGVDAYELGRIVKLLKGKGVDVAFSGRMDVRKGIDPHRLALKTEAVKECEKCHHAGSGFFQHVSLSLIGADGRPATFEAKQEVLSSLVSLFPLSQFYVIGATRIWLLDILLILAILGGLAFPVGHIILRILTIPVREARRLRALKKKEE